jgi:photosystem II stability/assembly factor-like uncharacterized protein
VNPNTSDVELDEKEEVAMSRKMFVHLSVNLTVCILVILLTAVLTDADEVNWHFVGLRGKHVQELYVHPETPTTLYALADTPVRRSSIYRSIDGGLSWKIVDNGVDAFALSPGPPDILYTSRTVKPVGELFESVALFESQDDGENWKQIYQEKFSDFGGDNIRNIVVPPNAEGLIYIAVQYRATGFYKSIDGGHSFRRIGGTGIGQSPFSFTVTPTHPEVVYWLDGHRGIFYKYSEATGRIELPVPENPSRRFSWPDSELNDYASSITVHPLQPDVLYAVRGSAFFGVDRAIFKSEDGGHNWKLIFRGRQGPSRLLFIHPRQPQIMYGAGYDYRTEKRAFYRSSDGGSSWRMINAPVPYFQFRTLVYSEKTDQLYAGTSDGVYIIDDLITSVRAKGKAISSWGRIKNTR